VLQIDTFDQKNFPATGGFHHDFVGIFNVEVINKNRFPGMIKEIKRGETDTLPHHTIFANNPKFCAHNDLLFGCIGTQKPA